MSVVGIISAVTQAAAAATTGAVTVYGAIEAADLAEQQYELQEELARRKMSLEESIYASQQKLLDIQAVGIEETQAINLSVAEAEAKLRQAQIERQRRLFEMQAEMEEMQIQQAREAMAKAQEQGLVLTTTAPAAEEKKFPVGTALAVGGGALLLMMFLRR